MLINPEDPRYHLGEERMDATHREFIDFVNRLDQADKTGFMELFPLLVEHTRAHFDAENESMRQSAFPAIAEHQAEHQRVLGELDRFAEKVRQGSIQFARAWVRDRLPDWFNLHAATMDSALAAHLKAREFQREKPVSFFPGPAQIH